MDINEIVVPEHWAKPQPEWGPWNRAQTMQILAAELATDPHSIPWALYSQMLAFIASHLRRQGFGIAAHGQRPHPWSKGIVEGIVDRFGVSIDEASAIFAIVFGDLRNQCLCVVIADEDLARQRGIAVDLLVTDALR